MDHRTARLVTEDFDAMVAVALIKVFFNALLFIKRLIEER